jgi:hypothetical protein
MNKTLKKVWVKALRSGEYKQIEERLHSDEGYCCLGVLCDLVKDRVHGKFKMDDSYSNAYEFLGEKHKLPNEVKEIARITKKGMDKLISLNDSGNDFKTIANYIERYY